MMKIGIYNRWLHTLGGGEKHSLALASQLSKLNDVTVISHKEINKSNAEERLNLDLSKVKFLFIPDRPAYLISELTPAYDLFINSSFMDFFPSYSAKSISLVFFPAKIEDLTFNKTKHKIGRFFKNWLSVPYIKQGVREIAVKNGHFSYLVDDNFSIELKGSSNVLPLFLSIKPHCVNGNKVSLCINGKVVQVQTYDGQNNILFNVKIEPSEKNKFLTIQIHNTEGDRIPTDFEIDRLLLLNNRYKLFVFLFETKLKNIGLRLQQLPFTSSDILKFIKTYDVIIANSRFTQSWIKRYWNINSEILYPLIDVENFFVGSKQNRIVTTGRFFAGGHNKKHDVMINAFKEMVNEGLENWELVLIGGSTPGEEHKKYLDQLKEDSKNYPIRFFVDTPFETLVDLLKGAAIYWHASGYGEDEYLNPIRFEHFGITTVEGMASGAVPVVINKGGQPEIINQGVNGYLWDDIEALKKYSLQLINDPELLQKLSINAMRDSKKFNTDSFQKALSEIMTKIGLTL